MKKIKFNSLYISMLIAGFTCSQPANSNTLSIRNGDIYSVSTSMTANNHYYVEDGTLDITAGGNVSAYTSQVGLNGGTGVVNVTNGGQVILKYNNNIYHAFVNIGGNENGPSPDDHTGSLGILNISGYNSLFDVTAGSAFAVGSYGAKGIINITNGGTLRSSATGGMWIGGRATDGNRDETGGTVNVSGVGSTLTTYGWIRVGMGSEGALNIRNGGQVYVTREFNNNVSTSSHFIVGTSYKGTLTVSGEGSLAKVDNLFTVGSEGDGTAVVSNGGEMAGQKLEIASRAGSTGIVAVGALEGDSVLKAGKLNFNSITFGNGNGSLVLNHTSNDFTLSADISGNGTISALNGTSWLTGNNAGFNGNINTSGSGILGISNQNSLGSSTVTNDGSLLVHADQGNDWTLTHLITGNGNLIKQGSGRVTLSDSLQSTGNTTVLDGTLFMGSRQSDYTLYSPLVTTGQNGHLISYGTIHGDVNNYGTTASFGTINGEVANYGEMVGTGAINGNVINNGDLAVGYGDSAIPLSFAINGNLTNNGIVHVGHELGAKIAGNTMHVSGDYHGNGGALFFNIYFDGDNTVTDKLYVNGNTSGNTIIIFHELSHQRTQISDVQLVVVNGESNGEFNSIGRLVAGKYEYYLLRGTGENSNHWYLTNHRDLGDDDGDTSNDIMFERPEAGAYAANIAASNTLFQTQFHDRAGGTWYTDPFTGEQLISSMWMRHVGGHQRFRDSGDQLRTKANRYVVQLGGDVAHLSTNGQDQVRIGVMGGYANQHSKTRNRLDNDEARGKVDGYSAGMYATWLQNQNYTGAYLDAWALWNWFDNTVSGDRLSSESYKSKGLTSSLEAGYIWKIAERNEQENIYLQPSAQVIWMDVKADKHQEENGTIIRSRGNENIQTRLGLRASVKHEDSVNNRTFEPFVEANWIHNSKLFGVSMNGDLADTEGTRNIGELKLGVEGRVTKNLNLWSNVSQQVGSEGYSDTGVMLGMRYSF